MTLNTAIEIKKYMRELKDDYEFYHIDSAEIINSDMSLLDMMNTHISLSESSHKANSFATSSKLVKSFFKEHYDVSFGKIEYETRNHFVMFRKDILYDIITSINSSYHANGFLECCMREPAEFMKKNFPGGTLIQYGKITNLKCTCKDYFKDYTIYNYNANINK